MRQKETKFEYDKEKKLVSQIETENTFGADVKYVHHMHEVADNTFGEEIYYQEPNGTYHRECCSSNWITNPTMVKLELVKRGCRIVTKEEIEKLLKKGE
jgi:hypothetical protein